METFTWSPNNEPQGTINLRVRTAQFGDGYAQSAGDGINGKEQSWPLTVTATTDDAQAIVDFFDRHQGYRAFFWTPPLGSVGLWRVAEYGIRPLAPNAYEITATFTRAFHP